MTAEAQGGSDEEGEEVQGKEAGHAGKKVKFD